MQASSAAARSAVFARWRRPARWALGASLLGFAALAWLVTANHGHALGVDIDAARWAQAQRRPWLTPLVQVFTDLNSVEALSIYTGLLAVGLACSRKHRPWLTPLLAIVAGGLVLNGGVKQVFQRPRPRFEDALQHLSTYSFPSGHACGATVFYAFLTLVALTHIPAGPWRRAIAVGAGSAVVLVAWSRVYLGAHYLTDVLAGAFEGLAWTALCLMALSPRTRPPG